MGQHFGSAVDTGWANPSFARVWDRHVQVAIGTVEERQAIARIAATHQAVDYLLGLPGQWPVTVSEARVVSLEKRLGMIDQNPPERTLVELTLPVEGSQTAGQHPLCLSGFRRPMAPSAAFRLSRAAPSASASTVARRPRNRCSFLWPISLGQDLILGAGPPFPGESRPVS